jgi:hypothetical protein
MRGLSVQLSAQTIKRVDDILLELLKYKEEAKDEDNAAEEAEKTKEEHHLVSMLQVAMKSKMDATFNLGYPQREEF